VLAFLPIIAEEAWTAGGFVGSGMDSGTADPCGMTTKKSEGESNSNGKWREGRQLLLSPLLVLIVSVAVKVTCL
jgi:hypothetical protein